MVTLSKRKLFAGALGVSMATALPKITLASEHPAMDVVRGYFEAYPIDSIDVHAVKLNQRFLELHGDRLFGTRCMRGPCDFFNGKPIIAKSRAFKTHYTIAMAQDLKSVCGIDPEHELIEIMVEGMGKEYIRELHPNFNIIPYIPIIPVKCVDPDTFEPMIGFKTRYAVVEI